MSLSRQLFAIRRAQLPFTKSYLPRSLLFTVSNLPRYYIKVACPYRDNCLQFLRAQLPFTKSYLPRSLQCFFRAVCSCLFQRLFTAQFAVAFYQRLFATLFAVAFPKGYLPCSLQLPFPKDYLPCNLQLPFIKSNLPSSLQCYANITLRRYSILAKRNI